MLQEYAERPRGWRVLNTPNGAMLVLGPSSAFQFKIIPLNPYEYTGAGIEIPEPTKMVRQIRRTPEFGLRNLMESDIASLVETLSNPVSTNQKLKKIMGRSPLSQDELRSSSVEHLLSGPVLTRPDLGSLHPDLLKHQTLLDTSAESIFRRQFPERAGMFL
jgi:hypothetical protein